ncbi:HAD-IC family P-type ATPase [Pyxidicoccus parkwayensis]|uniref:Magnesium-transporting ATPase, P-type 1 n=1 Tax=Pyxidicoccus parkwayensis TaxID=2813578 RepID=A0ABX7P4R5_9BACT|nr:HAD-IC family P-type ATPase [Pyxidicoccus parkwaysis]QSQ25392.1 HAD-IC family P-type ATPase [Pyxidicoccus parkwaysis]
MPQARARRNWRSWGFGLALLAAVILVVARSSEEREFALLLKQSAPGWLLVATGLQAATYLSQSAVWRSVLRRTPFRVPLGALYSMSFAKLFIDQAVPTAGISGSALIVHGLERRGVARGPVMACVVVETMTNYTALILALLVALSVADFLGEARVMVWTATGVLIVLVSLLIMFLVRLSRNAGVERAPRGFARIPGARALLAALSEAPPSLAHSPRVLSEATGFNFIIHLLDAATLWALLRSIGVDADPTGVFAAFMLSTLARTLGVIPGGLGTFEAASTGTLTLLGIPLAAALSATVLFRGFSFYVPLVPGLLLSRGELRQQREAARAPAVERYWALPPQSLFDALHTGPDGLAEEEAASRLERHGANELEASRRPTRLGVVWMQLESPLVLLLIVAAVISVFTEDRTDAVIVLAIVLGSVVLGYSRESRAQAAIARLRERITLGVKVLREGRPLTVPLPAIVPGDVVLLSSGCMVPADARLLEATDLYVSQAVLTGESVPVEKRPGLATPDAPLAARDNCVFRGTHVRSGTGKCLVVASGRGTAFSGVSRRLNLRAPETELDRSLRQFGSVLLVTAVLMVLVVFAANVLLARPPMETLLFALSLAVGLSPEWLPAAHRMNRVASAQAMAARGVLVRRLSAIESLGSMDVLCTDMTGTLEGAREAILELSRMGVGIKLITGDSRLVAEHVAREGGLGTTRVLTGAQLRQMSDEALWHEAELTELFVEVDPTQKQRIILALKTQGHGVGFMGDGVDDAPAMYAADASISVEQAADVAREAADFVLLQQHLDVVRHGIEAGRRTFVNTRKSILTTTSANLGNLVSTAVVSLFLPFLPLLAGQILLSHFLSALPAMGLTRDSVDPEWVVQPRRWNMRRVVRFMVAFGLMSAVFGFLTFGVLLHHFKAGPELFRTGWFIESLLMVLVIELVMRTRRPFYRSRPATRLLVTTGAVVVLSFVLPFLPLSGVLGFVPPPGSLLLVIVGITALYVAATARAKKGFFRAEA